MTIVAIYDISKKKVGDLELPDNIFAVPVKEGVIHRAVTAHLSNCRQGTAHTKTRAEVRGGGKKPYRQKGTGRARHGSLRSPIFVGGGAAFGPKNRDWHIVLPKKEKRVALKMALSQKNKENNLFVLESFASKNGKTKEIAKTLGKWNCPSAVIVTHLPDEKTVRAVRNIPNFKLIRAGDVNVYDLVRHEHLLITKGAVDNIVAKFAN